ncbi:putative phenol hydroxylase [Enhygromyxa salina]|uniref:Putative phenol hydroxylase n=1 Tax=Enhygromyxa salina TaxID=215803 RepID=A0A0C2CQR9_9BACT|nr:acyl-CoA dehydrogenase family protein [Enhygromyxa salina]KIG13531.1 putative phenol hydroxylase [Enhygromyxa salina]
MTDVQTLLDAINLDGSQPSLGARLRAAAPAAEANRRGSDELVAAMRDAGLFRMWRPKSLGGLELDAMTGVRIFEELARYDSSAGWNAHISNVVDIYGAWFPDSVSERVYAGDHHIYSGALNPPFIAAPHEREGGTGYLLNGRAPFASGVVHADHVLALALIPPATEGSPPDVFFTLLPQDQLVIHTSTWETLGMNATGSYDIEAKDLFIPADQMVPLAPRQVTAPKYATQQLYRLSMWPLVSALAAPALGVARAAIDDLVELATFKVPFYTQRALRDRDIVQSQVARAKAQLGAARAYYYEALQQAWDAVEQPGSSLAQAHKHKIQLATCHAIEQSAEIVGMMFRLAGSSGFRRGTDPRSKLELRFEKHLRDATTMTQHAFGSTSRYESVGQAMLGLDSDWPFFAF